jgi:hypothetical protein
MPAVAALTAGGGAYWDAANFHHGHRPVSTNAANNTPQSVRGLLSDSRYACGVIT